MYASGSYINISLHTPFAPRANNTNLIVSLQNTVKFLALLLQSLSDTIDSLGLSGSHLLGCRLFRGKSLGDISFKRDEGLEESGRNVAFSRDRGGDNGDEVSSDKPEELVKFRRGKDPVSVLDRVLDAVDSGFHFGEPASV